MTAAMLVLQPIFEADLPPEQCAYRPGRNAQQTLVEVEELLFRGHPEAVDADLADYFGSIPHADVLKSVARRIVDRRVLHLIKMWLECPVEETDDRGRNVRPKPGTIDAASRKAYHLTIAGESLHAPVCAGMDAGMDARAGAKPRLSHRDLCRRFRNPVQAGQS
jgi:hypothetical protein